MNGSSTLSEIKLNNAAKTVSFLFSFYFFHLSSGSPKILLTEAAVGNLFGFADHNFSSGASADHRFRFLSFLRDGGGKVEENSF